MPAKSAKQERFMQAIAHSPSFAKKAGVPQSVGKEFMKNPKKFARGGLSEKREFDNPEISKLYKTYNEAITNRATKGKGKSAEEAYNRLQNMREEEIQAKRGEEKRQRDERDKANRQHTMKRDVEEARKKGESYEKFFEDTRKDQLKRGALNKAAYDKGRAFELYTPEEIKSEFPNGFKKGGTVKDSKAMVGKEVAFMQKKGAPKSMVKHEMMEAGMKPSRAKKFARGGGIESRGKTKGKMC